jgi:hypothetical protein
MLNLSHNFRSLSIPTVAPKIPRDISVRSGMWPSSVLILGSVHFQPHFTSLRQQVLVLPATHCIHVDAIAYKHALYHDVSSLLPNEIR